MINLVNDYYTASVNYPQIIKAVGERMRTFLAETLYSSESEADALERIILADIDSGGDEAIRKATEYLGSNQDYPFTAYNFGNFEIVTEKMNSFAGLALSYSESMDSLVACVPIRQEFLATTFANNPDDYERIQKIFINMGALYTIIYADVELNETTYSYPVQVSMTPSKGQYAFGFSEYMKMNGIYDIVHTFELDFFDLILDTETTPIDDVDVSVEEKSPIDDSLNNIEYTNTAYSTDIPEVTISDPLDDAEDVPIENSIILTFNVTMDESYVNPAITLYPYFEHTLLWDDESKVLVINPISNLETETEYSVTIADTARSFYVYNTLDEYELTFTTEE